jgi:hypothetical protein
MAACKGDAAAIIPGDSDGGVARVAFTLPEWPQSANRLYRPQYRDGAMGWGLSDEHVAWRTKMGRHVPSRTEFKLDDDSDVHAELTLYYPFRHKNGNLRRMDATNFMKAIYDLVSRKLGFDDYRIRSGSFSSVDAEDRSVDVVLVEVRR